MNLATRRRTSVLLTAVALVAVALVVKALADTYLVHSVVDLRLIQLRLAYNSGVAFSFGDGLPAWIVVAIPAVITLAMVIYGWRAAPTSSRGQRIAGSAVLAGAVTNVLDRIGDGLVTDYLHTGWWPTFNLPDTLLVVGLAAFAITMLRAKDADAEAGQRSR